MERRKRKSALENYIDGLSDPPEKLKKISEFYNSLRHFYRKKWNSVLKLPNVQGVEVNLYRLYDTVMAFGGWQKVSLQEKWLDVAEMLGVGDDVMGGDYAIKLIYMRYLSKYEQIETVGDIDEMMDGEMSRSRGRAISFFATNENPISLSRTYEYVRRDERGQPSQEPDYAKLSKSLVSGLPNEVDFGLNVCTLLSHPGPRLIRLCHAPHLLTLLVAHCGVFDDDEEDLSDLYESWRTQGGRDFAKFWAASGIAMEQMEKFIPHAAKVAHAVDPDREFLTGISVEYDVKEPMSWRIIQVATIIRNLSFEPINRVTMATSWPLMKFLLLSASCNYAPLYTSAMDTLSNLACDIDLTWSKMTHLSEHTLLKIIQDGIMSNDKFKLIRSMEILTGLCSFEGNESTICDFLNKAMFDQIFNVVCVKDIMMCVYTLECLYQISEMGDVACQYLAEFPQHINMLVSMATLEAVSFGPNGLLGMKVVEYQPQMIHPGQGFPPHMQAGQPMPHGIQAQHPQFQTPQHQPRQQYIQPSMNHQHRPHMAPPQTPQSHPLPASQSYTPRTPAVMATVPPAVAAIAAAPTTPSTAGAAADANSKSQVDQLTEQWIRQNCVAEKNAETPRGELYAAYVDDLRNKYHSLSGSLAMFSNVIKSLYPEVVFKMVNTSLLMMAVGIRLVTPHRLAPASAAAAAIASNAPAGTPAPMTPTTLTPVPNPTSLAPLPSTPSVRPQMDTVVASHPIMQGILAKEPKPISSTPVVSATITAAPAAAVNGVVVNGTNRESSTESSRSNTPSTDGGATTSAGAPAVAQVCPAPVFARSLSSLETSNEVPIRRVRNNIPSTAGCTLLKTSEEPSPVEATPAVTSAPEAALAPVASSAPVSPPVAAPATPVAVPNGGLKAMLTKKIQNHMEKKTNGPETTETPAKAVEVVAEAKVEAKVEETPTETKTSGKTTPAPVNESCDLMCEWNGCGELFATAAGVLIHVSKVHVVDETLQLVCEWPGCDGTPRSRWSLITHVQDHHAQEQLLKTAAQKRKDGLAPATPAPYRHDIHREVPQHPGYSKHAAIEAIRRHAFNFLPRDITDDPEGPVTKSIRLTSCLILRNLARYSAEGRHLLRRHERHLCWLALSRLESSHALAQLLSELHPLPENEDAAGAPAEAAAPIATVPTV